MRTFVDTSALVKLYRVEPNSAAVRAHVTANDTLLLSQTTPLEFRSAFYGMVRQRILSVPQAKTYIGLFDADLPQYVLLALDDAVFARTQTLLDAYAVNEGLRPLDALQLASALEENNKEAIDLFLTTDIALARVATLCGLTVKP